MSTNYSFPNSRLAGFELIRLSSSRCSLLPVRDDQRAKLALPTAGRQASANLDPYNLSNDHHYEGMKHRVRQTFGSIIVQHAYPALKLQFPFVSRRPRFFHFLSILPLPSLASLSTSPADLFASLSFFRSPVVQNLPLQIRSSFVASSCSPVPYQHQDLVRAGSDSQEDEG